MKRAVALLALLVVAACGGGSKGGGAAPANDKVIAQAVADKIGCDGWTASSQELYVQEGGDCTYQGETITIDGFASNAQRDNFLKVASGFGGVYGMGDRWIIEADNPASVKAATAAAGGTMAP